MLTVRCDTEIYRSPTDGSVYLLCFAHDRLIAVLPLAENPASDLPGLAR